MPSNLRTGQDLVDLAVIFEGKELDSIFSKKDESEIISLLEVRFNKLIENKESIEETYDSALVLAVENNKISVVESLLRRKEFENINDIFQVVFSDLGSGPESAPVCRTLLGHAAYFGHFDMVQCLIRWGANVNGAVTLPEDYRTKMRAEGDVKNKEFSQFSSFLPFDYFNEKFYGKTPLHEVALGERWTKNARLKGEHAKIAKYLLWHNADLEIRDNAEKRPTDYCYDDGTFGLFAQVIAESVTPIFHQYNRFQEQRGNIERLIRQEANCLPEIVKLVVDYLDPCEEPQEEQVKKAKKG